MRRRLAAVVVVVIVAWFAWPAVASGAQLDRTAAALVLAGPAAAAALAAATGRPILAATALAGVGAYTSGLLSSRGVVVPVAVLVGTASGGAVGALVAALCARLNAPAVLLSTLMLTVAGGALVQSLPAITGAESGLGPLPAIGIPLNATQTAVATPVGDYHVLLAVAAACAVIAALLLHRGPGAVLRAVGSDRARAAASGVRPFAAEAGALAIGGLLAGVCGALGAHVARVATPEDFAFDVAALPLLAALAAGREPIAAATVAVATGIAAQVVLPAAGWQGPPDASSLSLGVLGVAALFTLLPTTGPAQSPRPTPVDADSPWPLEALGIAGSVLRAQAIRVLARNGEPLVDAPAFSVEPGHIQALVGANGAGKSTLIRTLVERAGHDASVTLEGDGGLALMPQEGGGFAQCTVHETLVIAARRGLSRASPEELASAWQARLGLGDEGGALCAELPAGRRRLVELGRVLLGRPGVLLCDEPLAGLDDSARAAVVSCLRAAAAAGLGIVIAEHDRDAVASLTQRVLVLERADFAAPGRATVPA